MLGVTKGDGNIDWLRTQGVTNMLELRNYETMIQAAKRGDIRLFFSDNPTAIYWLNKYQLEKHFRHTAPLNHGALHWATLKKTTLCTSRSNRASNSSVLKNSSRSNIAG